MVANTGSCSGGAATTATRLCSVVLDGGRFMTFGHAVKLSRRERDGGGSGDLTREPQMRSSKEPSAGSADSAITSVPLLMKTMARVGQPISEA